MPLPQRRGLNRTFVALLFRIADPDRLDVAELADALDGELPAVTGTLDAAERQLRIGGHIAVDEDHSGVQIADEPGLFGLVAGPCIGAEPELRAVGEFPEADVLEARHAHLAFTTYSLDAPLSDREDPALLADMLAEDDNAVEHATDIEAVNAHLDQLPEREQRILMLRFYGNLTQDQIGDRLGISQMHVSRLLTRALTYLRDQLTTDPVETA